MVSTAGGEQSSYTHHGLREALNKLGQGGVLQNLEHGVPHFLLVVHVISLVATKLVLCNYLKAHRAELTTRETRDPEHTQKASTTCLSTSCAPAAAPMPTLFKGATELGQHRPTALHTQQPP